MYNFIGRTKNYTVEKFIYRNLDHENTFKKIYLNKTWGSKKKYLFYSGDGSHNEKIIKPYIKKIVLELKKIKNPILIDAGCGDFNIGKYFINYAKKIYAYDIFEELIKHNKKKYNYRNLVFKKKNIVTDNFPISDVFILRQVLQHLSNKDIQNFLKKLKKRTRYLIITEHIPSTKFISNIDKPRGHGLRFNSGVILHEKPFNLNHLSRRKILAVNAKPDPGIIVTIIYKLK